MAKSKRGRQHARRRARNKQALDVAYELAGMAQFKPQFVTVPIVLTREEVRMLYDSPTYALEREMDGRLPITNRK